MQKAGAKPPGGARRSYRAPSTPTPTATTTAPQRGPVVFTLTAEGAAEVTKRQRHAGGKVTFSLRASRSASGAAFDDLDTSLFRQASKRALGEALTALPESVIAEGETTIDKMLQSLIFDKQVTNKGDSAFYWFRLSCPVGVALALKDRVAISLGGSLHLPDVGAWAHAMLCMGDVPSEPMLLLAFLARGGRPLDEAHMPTQIFYDALKPVIKGLRWVAPRGTPSCVIPPLPASTAPAGTTAMYDSGEVPLGAAGALPNSVVYIALLNGTRADHDAVTNISTYGGECHTPATGALPGSSLTTFGAARIIRYLLPHRVVNTPRAPPGGAASSFKSAVEGSADSARAEDAPDGAVTSAATPPPPVSTTDPTPAAPPPPPADTGVADAGAANDADAAANAAAAAEYTRLYPGLPTLPGPPNGPTPSPAPPAAAGPKDARGRSESRTSSPSAEGRGAKAARASEATGMELGAAAPTAAPVLGAGMDVDATAAGPVPANVGAVAGVVGSQTDPQGNLWPHSGGGGLPPHLSA